MAVEHGAVEVVGRDRRGVGVPIADGFREEARQVVAPLDVGSELLRLGLRCRELRPQPRDLGLRGVGAGALSLPGVHRMCLARLRADDLLAGVEEFAVEFVDALDRSLKFHHEQARRCEFVAHSLPPCTRRIVGACPYRAHAAAAAIVAAT